MTHDGPPTADSNDDEKPQSLKFNRCIVKISGEMLKGQRSLFDPCALDYISEQIKQVHSMGACIGVVIGGGNILRGRDVQWLNKIDADICGMLATVINGIMLHSKLHAHGIPVRLSSGIPVQGVVERCNPLSERHEYDSGTVIIFVGGTGNPLFTTDTAAALRAVEFKADIVVKATKVDGVYSADPEKTNHTQLYTRLTYDEAINRNLKVMDLAAFNICREANIPIHVYNLVKYPLASILTGSDIGTRVTNGG